MQNKSDVLKKIILMISILSLSSCSNNKTSISNNSISNSTNSAVSIPTLKNASIEEDTKFNACIVKISIEEFNNLGFNLGDSLNIKFTNGYALEDIPYFNGYYVKNQAPVVVAYPGNEYILITLNNLGIWSYVGLSSNDKVDITLNTAKKYLSTQEALGQSYSLSRDEYDSDEEFSNFRALKGGSLKENLIYRGASPVDNSRNRAKCTNDLLEKNSINTIVDLADSEENINTYFSDSSFSSTYTKNIYDNGNMILLSMGSGYESDKYKQSVVSGFKFMLTKTGPYYIHCMEGKDRTGFVCTLIEALCGASYEEMRDDYMITYKNYYKITKEKDSDKYDAIVSLYFHSFLEALHGIDDAEEFKTADFQEDAKNYLKQGGMTDTEISDFIKLICND